LKRCFDVSICRRGPGIYGVGLEIQVLSQLAVISDRSNASTQSWKIGGFGKKPFSSVADLDHTKLHEVLPISDFSEL